MLVRRLVFCNLQNGTIVKLSNDYTIVAGAEYFDGTPQSGLAARSVTGDWGVGLTFQGQYGQPIVVEYDDTWARDLTIEYDCFTSEILVEGWWYLDGTWHSFFRT
jgi:hypothetical protein